MGRLGGPIVTFGHARDGWLAGRIVDGSEVPMSDDLTASYTLSVSGRVGLWFIATAAREDLAALLVMLTERTYTPEQIAAAVAALTDTLEPTT